MKKYGIAFLLTLSALNASAVSFDCNKASTPIEKAICGDPLLGKLDDALAQNYKFMMAANIGDGPRNDLRTTQKAWIAARNKCTNKACLVDAYKQRVDAICDYPVISGAHPVCTTSEEAAGEIKAPEPAAQSAQKAQQTTSSPSNLLVGRDYDWIGVSNDLGEESRYSLITCKSKSDVFLFWTSFQEGLEGNRDSHAKAVDMSKKGLCTASFNIGKSPNEIHLFIKGKRPSHSKGLGYINHELEAFVLSKNDGDSLTRVGWITAYDLQYNENTRELLTFEFKNGKFIEISR